MRSTAARVFFWGNVSLATGFFAWALWRFGGPAWQTLGRDPSWPQLAGAGCAIAATFAGWTLRWRATLPAGARAPSLGRLAAYRAAGQSVSMLVPSAKLGGEPLRAYLLARGGVPAPDAVASVAVDRLADIVPGALFTIAFAAALLWHGVAALEPTVATAMVAAVAMLAAAWMGLGRLRRGRGVLAGLVRSTAVNRVWPLEQRLAIVGDAEARATAVVQRPRLVARTIALSVAVNLVVLVEYRLLLGAFGLPCGPIEVVGAIFATGAAHSVPVPAGIGFLEGAEMLLFSSLGYGAETGLAVGLAVRLREIVWVLPGLAYLLAGALRRAPERQPAAAEAAAPLPDPSPGDR